jgi:hypothetical protein
LLLGAIKVLWLPHFIKRKRPTGVRDFYLFHKPVLIIVIEDTKHFICGKEKNNAFIINGNDSSWFTFKVLLKELIFKQKPEIFFYGIK